MEADDPDDPQAVRAEIERHDKRVATLKARAALAGYQLLITTGPAGGAELVLVRWGRMRAFADAEGVERFLSRVGG
jgi:hypothetical protein